MKVIEDNFHKYRKFSECTTVCKGCESRVILTDSDVKFKCREMISYHKGFGGNRTWQVGSIFTWTCVLCKANNSIVTHVVESSDADEEDM